MLSLVAALWVIESLTVPVSQTVVPVLKKACKPKVTEETAQDKTLRKRSPKTTATGTSVAASGCHLHNGGGTHSSVSLLVYMATRMFQYIIDVILIEPLKQGSLS
ncbi:MAG: hypothetical protein MH252_18390 [Thermosynechococcaceae cyanobacterium MS004]|nr:hypothetical protein [Thermosynechococcaceae cyanobacterium MS004]